MAKKNGVPYSIELKMSNSQRAAHFLDWNAKQHPGEFVAYNVLLKNITGVGRMPQLKSDEVEGLRRNNYAVKRYLFDRYGREMVSIPGVGVRASIDDADVLKNVVPKRATRLQSARKGFIKTVSNIDQANIPDTAEMRPLKGWLTHAVKDIMKQISSPEFERKLLPPAVEKKEEKKPVATLAPTN